LSTTFERSPDYKPVARRSASLIRSCQPGPSWPLLICTGNIRCTSPTAQSGKVRTSVAYIHTSGHASPADLRAFAAAVHPKMVVPVHGIKWDEESHGFGPVRRLADGETMVIP
jgi:hypothetical protein